MLLLLRTVISSSAMLRRVVSYTAAWASVYSGVAAAEMLAMLGELDARDRDEMDPDFGGGDSCCCG